MRHGLKMQILGKMKVFLFGVIQIGKESESDQTRAAAAAQRRRNRTNWENGERMQQKGLILTYSVGDSRSSVQKRRIFYFTT